MKKTYIIYSKNGSFKVEATNLKEAKQIGRFNCRMTGDKFEGAKLKRQP